MSKTTYVGMWISLGVLLLAACSDGDSGSTPPPAPPPGPVSLEDQLGTGFGRLFRAQANTDPTEPQSSDVIPASLTTDPIPVP